MWAKAHTITSNKIGHNAQESGHNANSPRGECGIMPIKGSRIGGGVGSPETPAGLNIEENRLVSALHPDIEPVDRLARL